MCSLCQIPLKDCERLDQSLALALNHLTLPHQRNAPGTPFHTHTQPDMDKQMGDQTQTLTDTNTHSDAERHKETWMDVPTLLDSCSGELEGFYFEATV